MRAVRLAAVWLVLTASALSGSALAETLTPLERHGEAIFLTGTSPARNPIVAVAAGANRLPGSAAACAGCHGRDGSGRREGGIAAPDIRWSTLAETGRRDLSAGRSIRPYDEKTLARAITEGVDSSGNQLASAMPRFELYAEDLDAVLAYLRRMHTRSDPGISADSITFGVLLPLSGRAASQGRALQTLLQHGLDDINRRGGIHGRRLALDALDADQTNAAAQLEQLAESSLAILAPYAPPLHRAIQDVAASGVPVVAPVTGPEPDGMAPLFSTLPAQRHVLGALAAYWSRLPEKERSTMTVVLGERNRGTTEESLRDLLPRSSRVTYASPQQLLTGTATLGDWVLLDTAPGVIEQLADQLRGRNILAASASISTAPGNLLSQAGRIIVAAPLLPPRDDPRMKQSEELLSQRKLTPPPPIVTLQALRAITLIEEALRTAGRELNRERLIQAIENIAALEAMGGPLTFGLRQRFGARGAALFSMEPETGRLSLLRAWSPSL